MDDLPPFDQWWHDLLLKAGHLYPKALDGRTHFVRTIRGRVKPACGSPKGTRLHTDWRLVSCPDCRAQATTQPAATTPTNGLFPIGYRYRIRGTLHTVTGHREVGYGHISHEVDCDGVTCFQAFEYIQTYGTEEKGILK